MTSSDFFIPGIPRPKGRPRLGKGGNVYTPERTRSYEREIGWLAREAGHKPIDGPVSLAIVIYFTPPTAWREADRLAAIGQFADSATTDADNVVKAVADALNHVCYHDDRQVCRIVATKRWGKVAGVDVSVRRADEERTAGGFDA